MQKTESYLDKGRRGDRLHPVVKGGGIQKRIDSVGAGDSCLTNHNSRRGN